jgi:CarD family transcriptional regulator
MLVTLGRLRRGAYAVGRGIAESGAVVKGLEDMTKPKKAAPAKAKEYAFEKGDFVVYPTHGVGRVIDIEAKEIAGHKLDLFVINVRAGAHDAARSGGEGDQISGLRKPQLSARIMESALKSP